MKPEEREAMIAGMLAEMIRENVNAAIANERARCLAHARKWLHLPGGDLQYSNDRDWGEHEAAQHIAAAIDSGEAAVE